ncbi:MAG: adenylate/guanylate cyclase domain-containing protein [Thermodesulfobacteriota bacterium]
MAEEKVRRKLAAILSADVQGYSRLMGEDEVATVRTLTAHREIMTSFIEQHQGRVVDSPGDNLLAEFASVVDAVECAMEMQGALKVRNDKLPEDRRMVFRIGINLGDIIEEGDRIYGDGVNIAARLEGLAEGGGICISGSAYDQIEGKLALDHEYLGEQSVKNIKRPVRSYRIRRVSEPVIPHLKEKLPLPDKPSIAVLPFVNMSGDPEQEYFSDGITEDLITDLSKISGLFVIARNSTFTYKGRPVNVQQVGRDLGVRYVLEGSVRKAGDRVRITAQLVDAGSGGHLWAERYDRALQDIFALQDEVTQKIVAVLAVRLTEGEQIRRACKCRQPCDIEAYDDYLRGLEYLLRFTEEANARAREIFEKSVRVAPNFALAHTRLGDTYLNEWVFGWSQDPGRLDSALDLAKKAIALDESLSEPHDLLGRVYLWKGRHEEAIAELQRAVSLDPNDAECLAGLGSVLAWSGRPEEALDLTKRAMRLNPRYPVYYLWNLGHAYFLMERYQEAIAAFERSLNVNADFYPARFFLAASYSLSGRIEEARAEVEGLLAKGPEGCLRFAGQRLPYKDPAILIRLFEALSRVGLTSPVSPVL